MTLEELKKEISIWDKWGYSFTSKTIVCYTLHDVYEDEPKDDKIKVDSGYKAKRWIHDISLIDFAKLLLNDELRGNFVHEHDEWFWVTEYVNAEEHTENEPNTEKSSP